MNVRTDSDVKVLVSNGEKSKVLAFDKPVRSIELTKEESLRIGAALIRDTQKGVTAEIRKLIDSGFFSSPRRFREIRAQLSQEGTPTKSASLNVVLAKMVERGELRRDGQKRSYRYRQPM